MPSIKLSQWARENNMKYDTAYKRYMKGYIPKAYQTDSGAVFVETEDSAWKDDLIKFQKEKIEQLECELEKYKLTDK